MSLEEGGRSESMLMNLLARLQLPAVKEQVKQIGEVDRKLEIEILLHDVSQLVGGAHFLELVAEEDEGFFYHSGELYSKVFQLALQIAKIKEVLTDRKRYPELLSGCKNLLVPVKPSDNDFIKSLFPITFSEMIEALFSQLIMFCKMLINAIDCTEVDAFGQVYSEQVARLRYRAAANLDVLPLLMDSEQCIMNPGDPQCLYDLWLRQASLQNLVTVAITKPFSCEHDRKVNGAHAVCLLQLLGNARKYGKGSEEVVVGQNKIEVVNYSDKPLPHRSQMFRLGERGERAGDGKGTGWGLFYLNYLRGLFPFEMDIRSQEVILQAGRGYQVNAQVAM